MANKSYVLTAKSQEAVISYMARCWNDFDIATKRDRYLTIDKAIQLESEIRRKSADDQRLDYYDDIEIPIITPAVDTIQGFLVDLYLVSPQIFPVVSADVGLSAEVRQFNALNLEHAQHFKWARHLALAFRSLAKYNIGGVECTWASELTTTVGTDVAPGNKNAAVLTEAVTEGNAMRALDMYNTFYDRNVEPAEVHNHGEYIGYVECIGMVQVAQRLKALQVNGNKVMNATKCFDSATTGQNYYTPPVTGDYNNKLSKGWGNNFFSPQVPESTTKKQYGRNVQTTYEWTVLYARIIPAMFGIKLPGSSNVQIWKYIRVNDVLVYAERQGNAHAYLPCTLGQIREEQLAEQNKSPAEFLIPLQNLSTKLYDARLSSLARNVGDRLAMMEESIDPASITNSDPTSPVVVRPNMNVKDVRAAVMQLPFSDTMGATYLNEINSLKITAQEITRLNRPQLGQFQKGNKTLGEFREVMNNANAELRVMGILIENSVMSVLKLIVKTNLIQFQQPGAAVGADGKPVTIDPVALRKALVNFKLADGLVAREDYVDTQLLREALAYMQQNQQANMEYDIMGMIVHMFETQGINLQQYKLTPEQVQQRAATAAPQPATPAAGT